MPDGCSRDKAYLKIRREAKQPLWGARERLQQKGYFRIGSDYGKIEGFKRIKQIVNRTRISSLFPCESHVLAMTVVSSRDKTYVYIRCEAKLANGASGATCSRKGVER
jgi:hypothetical protein